MDKWETTSLDNVVWLLNAVERFRPPNRADLGLKFFVTREGEARYEVEALCHPSALAFGLRLIEEVVSSQFPTDSKSDLE